VKMPTYKYFPLSSPFYFTIIFINCILIDYFKNIKKKRSYIISLYSFVLPYFGYFKLVFIAGFFYFVLYVPIRT